LEDDCFFWFIVVVGKRFVDDDKVVDIIVFVGHIEAVVGVEIGPFFDELLG